MKTINRIHRNGATKSASAQTKTSRLVRLKNHTAVEPSPVPSNPSPQSAEMIIPSKIADECKDALSLLKEVGSAAGALVMLNADVIKESAGTNSGWEAFEAPRFGKGAQELARMTVDEFDSVFTALADYLSGMIQSIEECSEPIPTVSRVAYYGLIKNRDGGRVNHEIENAVRSFQHCIEIQGSALDSRQNDGAYSLGILMKDRLSAAFDTIWKAKGKLEGAYLAATVRYNPAAVERMVAA